MPHLEKGKRHYSKGFKKIKCEICQLIKEIPTNKKANVCFDYKCQNEWQRRKTQKKGNGHDR